MIPVIKEIEVEASSFAGIAKSTAFGSEFVSTIAKVGMFNLFASAEQLSAGAKVKSSNDGEAKGPGKKPRRKINS